jgi:lipid-binding SYLF domain-containing protein
MRYIVTVGLILFGTATAANPVISSAETDRVQDAAEVLHQIHAVPDEDIPEDLWERASCAVVIPSVKKAAFFVGGEYGKGVMSCRSGGHWSAPAFVELEKGSIGFQIGGQSVDLVMLVMNDQGVNRLLQDKVALGAEGSVAGGPVGRDARALTDLQLHAEILTYSRTQGLFAGIDLSGGVFKPDTDANRDVYGSAITPRDQRRRRSRRPSTGRSRAIHLDDRRCQLGRGVRPRALDLLRAHVPCIFGGVPTDGAGHGRAYGEIVSAA